MGKAVLAMAVAGETVGESEKPGFEGAGWVVGVEAVVGADEGVVGEFFGGGAGAEDGKGEGHNGGLEVEDDVGEAVGVAGEDGADGLVGGRHGSGGGRHGIVRMESE
jgi:hypothetical protein